MHNKKFIAMMMAFVLSATPVFAAAQENEGLNQTEPIDVIETNIDETESDLTEDLNQNIDENPTDIVSETEEEITEPEEVSYNIWLGQTQITKDNAADIFGDGTASYNAETNVLTLHNLTIDEELNYGLNIDGDIEIKLVGSNSISNEGVCGIRSTGSITFTGDGSLTVFGLDYGIYARQNIYILESVNLDVSCGDITAGDNFAIYAGYYESSQIVITDNAKVAAKAGYAPVYSYGIYSEDNLEISGNAVVHATGGAGNERSCGLYAISNIWVNDSAQVTTIGHDIDESPDPFNDSYGIRTTQLYINGGSLTAIGGKSTSYSSGIYAQLMIMEGGNLVSKGGVTTQGPSNGLKIFGDLKISNGHAEVSSADVVTGDSIAIDACIAYFDHANVLAYTGEAERAGAILADTMTVDNSTLDLKTGKSKDSARGLQAYGAMKINNSNVNIELSEAENGNYGIQSTGGLTIDGGQIDIVCENAPVSQGIWAFEFVDIKEGHLNIKTAGDGICVPYGTILIGVDETAVASNENDMQAPDIRILIDAEGEYAIYAGLGLKINEKLSLGKENDLKIAEFKNDDGGYWTLVDEDGEAASKDVLIAPEEVENESESTPETEEESKPETESERKEESESENKPETESESKKETKPGESPGTGDSVSVKVLTGMMSLSFAVLLGLFVFWKKNKVTH